MAKRINYAKLYTLRKDGRYQGSYTDKTGRHYVYDKDPEKLHKKIQNRISQAPHVFTFKEVENAWETAHRPEISERTWNNYAPHASDMVDQYGELPIDQIEAADVAADLARAKARGLSATVVKTRRSIFRMVFNQAIIDGHIKYNPVSAVKLPKGLKTSKRKAPTKEQMQIILSNASEPFGLFPFLLLCTGLRKSEALALEWSDIDLKKRTISITKTLTYIDGANATVKEPKSTAGIRTVPIIDILAKELHPGKGLVFPAEPSTRGGKGGGHMTERGYEGAWLRYCQRVGLMENGKPAITAHNLRHGTATLMFELGVDELSAQKILGHSKIEITREIYTDLRDEQQAKSVKKLNRGMSKLMSTIKKASN